MCKYRFSVFTATYNRAHLLPIVYNDLLKQTFQDFEWVIIDDGSSDSTYDVVQSFILEGKLQIKYFRHDKNYGKYQAWRTATKLMEGRYELGADDDDSMPYNAIEIFNLEWKQLESESDYDDFWEIRGRCVDEKGRIVGRIFELDRFDSDYNTFNYAMGNGSVELQGCRKLTVLRNEAAVPDHFLFEDKVSNFPEIIRWSRAARKYKTRFISKVVRVYKDTPNGLSRGKGNIRKNYNGLVQCIYVLNEQSDLLWKYSKKNFFYKCLILAWISKKVNEPVLKYLNNTMIRLCVFLLFPIVGIISLLKK